MSDPTSPVIPSGAYPLRYLNGISSAGIPLTYWPLGENVLPAFDWTGWTASQVFLATPTAITPTLTLAVTLGGATGVVTIPALTAAQTAAMFAAWRQGVYYINCVRTSDTFTLRFIDMNQVVVSP